MLMLVEPEQLFIKISRVLERIPMEHIDKDYSQDSGLSFDSVWSKIILEIEISSKNCFPKRFLIVSRVLERILMKHLGMKNSIDSKAANRLYMFH